MLCPVIQVKHAPPVIARRIREANATRQSQQDCFVAYFFTSFKNKRLAMTGGACQVRIFKCIGYIPLALQNASFRAAPSLREAAFALQML